jgi:hypothetical protein
MGKALLCVLLSLGGGCVVIRGAPTVCPDGKPLKILTHPDCDRGVCGYTCAPGRWTEPVP